MNAKAKPLESTVAQGWILMFLVFICINFIEFMNAAVQGDLVFFAGQEGAIALRAMIALMLLHAFVPMLVLTLDRRWFRWAVAVLTMGLGVAMLAHEMVHLFVVRNRGFGMFDLLDFAHHVLALWVSAAAVRWARSE